MNNRASVLFCALLIFCGAYPALAQTVSGQDQPTVLPASANYLRSDNSISGSDGGRLTGGLHDVLVNQHGLCRWLDNNNVNGEYFVPYRTLAEWQAFISNAPGLVVRAECCPATSILLTASDGQQSSISLPIGRDGASAPLGRVTASHVFTLTRVSDGATWPETATEEYVCTGGAWAGQGVSLVGTPPPPLNCGTHANGATWYQQTGSDSRPADLAECPDGAGTRVLNWDIESEYVCTAGVPTLTGSTRAVNAVWSGVCNTAAESCPGTLTFAGVTRRAHHSVSSQTFASSNDKPYMNSLECAAFGVTHYSCSPSSRYAVTTFNFPSAVKNTHVKVTAKYGSYGSFSDGTPKVAEFDIVDGQVINADNTPAVGIFEMTGRMGGPFVMTNNVLYMPAYDSSPNLTQLTLECGSTPPPPPPPPAGPYCCTVDWTLDDLTSGGQNQFDVASESLCGTMATTFIPHNAFLASVSSTPGACASPSSGCGCGQYMNAFGFCVVSETPANGMGATCPSAPAGCSYSDYGNGDCGLVCACP